MIYTHNIVNTQGSAKHDAYQMGSVIYLILPFIKFNFFVDYILRNLNNQSNNS